MVGEMKKLKETVEKELQIAVQLAREASQAILPFYYGGVEKNRKADGTPVTEADKRANEIILNGLQKIFPQDGIVSEELETVKSKSGKTWYVDPIDGTKGFLGHSDQFAIHIGLAGRERDSNQEYEFLKRNHLLGHWDESRNYASHPEKPIFGLVYKPINGEYYFGGSGLGAWRVHPDGSRKELHVAEEREGIRIVVNSSFLREQPLLTQMLHPKKVYVSGSLGLRAMRVAEGIAEVYLKERKHSGGTWDTCAPQAIVEAAGGFVAYTNGTPVTYSGQRHLEGRLVMASNGTVGRYVSEMMEKYVKEEK